MSSELALHAYVFLGNALHLLLSREGHRSNDGRDGAQVSPEELAELNAKVEPLTPATILTGIAELSNRDRELLARCGRICLSGAEPDFQALLGLEPDEARQVLDWLDAQAG